MDISDDARMAGRRPGSRRLRWAKLIAALALATLVGVGSYAATYHLLVLLSAPPAAVIAPVGSGIVTHAALVPGPATSAHPSG